MATKKTTKTTPKTATRRRPSKQRRALIRAAAAEAAGGISQLGWLWKNPSVNSDAGESKENTRPDYHSRRLALAALGLGWLMVLLAVTDLISFAQLMML